MLLAPNYGGVDGDHDSAAYIVHGPISGTSQLADTDTLITTNDDSVRLGYASSASGDLNGDGLPEVALGSGSYSSARGGVWIFEPPLSGTLTTDDADASFVGEAYGQAGDAVSSGGDVDGDGYGDLLVGAWDYSDMGGRAYLVLGPFDGSSSLRDAAAIVEADGLSAQVGDAVSLEQDLDADGRADVVIGAPGAVGAPYEGAVFVFYETFEGTVNAFDEADAVLYSVSKEGWHTTGGRLGPAGDVNGDGFDDLYIHGEVEYLVFGEER